jgi:hypothetical protein
MIVKLKPVTKPKPAETTENEAEEDDADSADSDDDSASKSDGEEPTNREPGLSEAVLAKLNHPDDADSDNRLSPISHLKTLLGHLPYILVLSDFQINHH